MRGVHVIDPARTDGTPRTNPSLDEFGPDLLWFPRKGYFHRFYAGGFTAGNKGLVIKTHIPSIRDRKAQREKKRDRPMKFTDRREKAILLLLWGKKGCKRYRGSRRSGFLMESLFEFLRAKREDKERGDV